MAMPNGRQANGLLYTHDTILLPEIPATETRVSFRGGVWRKRSRDLEAGLPRMQPATASCRVAVVAQRRSANFREVFASLFCKRFALTRDAATLLLERGHTLTLAQAQSIGELKYWSERVSSASMLFFTPTGKAVDPVAVRSMGCLNGQWYVTGELCLEAPIRWPLATTFLFNRLDPASFSLRLVYNKDSR